MRVGAFQIEQINERSSFATHSTLGCIVPDRSCNISVTGLKSEFDLDELPYFAFLETAMITLISLASRDGGVKVPFLLPEQGSPFEVKLHDASIVFFVRGLEFFRTDFAEVFFEAARLFRAECDRIEHESGIEGGLNVMLSTRRGL